MLKYDIKDKKIVNENNEKLSSEKIEEFLTKELKMYDSIFLYFCAMKKSELKMLIESGYTEIKKYEVIRGLLTGPDAKENLKLIKEMNVTLHISEEDLKSVSSTIIATDITRIGNLMELPDLEKFSQIMLLKNNDGVTMQEAIDGLTDEPLKLKVVSNLLGGD